MTTILITGATEGREGRTRRTRRASSRRSRSSPPRERDDVSGRRLDRLQEARADPVADDPDARPRLSDVSEELVRAAAA